jgi:hypothetical protein
MGCCLLIGCKKKNVDLEASSLKKESQQSLVTLEPAYTQAKIPQAKKAVILPKQLREQLMNRDNSQVLLNADFSYPQIENLGKLETIDMINKEIEEKAVDEFKKSMEEVKVFAQDFYDYHEEQGRPSSLLPFVSEQTYEIKYNDNYILSIFVTTFTYFGGAHPNTSYSSYTYNLITGEKLSVSYFLPDEMTEDEVKQYVAQLFYTVYNEEQERFYPDTGETLTQGKFEYGYYVTDEDIVFYINPYIIAPYVAGIQEVSTKRKDIFVH